MVGQSYVDRYRLLELLDTGGRGALFAGEEIVGGERVLLKVIHPVYARGVSGIEPYLRAAGAAGTIEHASLPRFVATGRDEGGAPYIVRRREDGVSLANRIAKKGPLPPRAALDLAEQLLGALSAAHARGLVHRAITPARVFLREGPAVLLDWGAAHLTAAAEGAPYRAPEQRAGEKGDARSDLYALALTLVEALTGRSPSTEGDGHTALAAARGQLDAAAGAVIEHALEEAPGDRFATAEEFLAAIRAARAPAMAPVVAPAAPAPAPAPPASAAAAPSVPLASPATPDPKTAAPAPGIGTKASPASGKSAPGRKRKRTNGAGANGGGASVGNPAALTSGVGTVPGNVAASSAADAGPTMRMAAPPEEVLAAQPAAMDIEALERRATELSGLFQMPNAPGEAGPVGASERIAVAALATAAVPLPPVPAMAPARALAPARAPSAGEEDLPTGRSPTPLIIGGVAAAALILLVVILATGGGGETAPRSLFSRVHVSITTRPADATLEIDGQPVANPHDGSREASGEVHHVVARAAGYANEERSMKFDRDVSLELALRSVVPAAATPVAKASAAPPPTTAAAAPERAPAPEPTPVAAPEPSVPTPPPAAAPTPPTALAANTPPTPPARVEPAPAETVRPAPAPAPTPRRLARRQARRQERRAQAPTPRRTPTKAPAKRPARGGFVRDNPF
jgi:serine/threonine-protein kinase